MTRRLSDEKAAVLAQEAVQLAQAGENEKASRKLREAAALGHNNADVQAAFLILHKDRADVPLMDRCRRYAQYHDEQAGEDAVQYLRAQRSTISGDTAVECLKLILESKPSQLSASQDTIISELARQSHDVRLYISMELQASITEFFDNIYERGDLAANVLRVIVLDSSLWPEEAVRLRVEEDLFQLFIAKLMESGHDLDGRALKGIALLLMADASRLQAFVDEEGFDALLTSLDIQLPADVRGQATLASSKYIEVAESTAQQFFTNYINTHVKKQKAESVILAFSAGAAIFPVAPAIVSPVFLTENFLPSLMPLLERKVTSTTVHDSFLALLSAACVDSACRAAITKHCAAWLSHKVSNGTERQNSQAAMVLAKLRTAGGENRGSESSSTLKTNDDVLRTHL